MEVLIISNFSGYLLHARPWGRHLLQPPRKGRWRRRVVLWQSTSWTLSTVCQQLKWQPVSLLSPCWRVTRRFGLAWSLNSNKASSSNRRVEDLCDAAWLMTSCCPLPLYQQLCVWVMTNSSCPAQRRWLMFIHLDLLSVLASLNYLVKCKIAQFMAIYCIW